MSRTHAKLAISVSVIGLLSAFPAAADTPFFFSTGNPDGKIATASRPDGNTPSTFEIESADDFVLTHGTSITSATFTGLLPAGASPANVVVEIYRVFPNDSTDPPSGHVPSRVNSPSDIAFEERDNGTGLSFTTTSLGPLMVANSVQPGGIHPIPGFHTGGDGPVSGNEVRFDVTFATPFDLPADHYFFVPQVQLDDGNFLWLSAPRPIQAPGTPFPPGFTDLQSWTRDEMLDPDWLRVGQDIVGGDPFPTFNAAFSLNGALIPEPSTWAMMLLGFAGLGFAGYRQARRARAATA